MKRPDQRVPHEEWADLIDKYDQATGKTRQQVADLLCVSKNTLQRWNNQSRRAPQWAADRLRRSLASGARS